MLNLMNVIDKGDLKDGLNVTSLVENGMNLHEWIVSIDERLHTGGQYYN